MNLSVIIPYFNELKTIDTVVAAARNSPFDNKEIISADDFSTDRTREEIRNEIGKRSIK
jgi:glycosyltransferase involved in cell wall biosynthesis